MSDKPIKDCIIEHETDVLKWGDVFSINPDSPGVKTPRDRAAALDFLFRAVPPPSGNRKKRRKALKEMLK